MKKINILLVILIMCLYTIGCSKNVKLDKETQKKSIQQPSVNSAKVNNKDTIQPKVDSITGKDINAFVPIGWRILDNPYGKPSTVKGDLNNDGIEDVAAVIEGPKDTEQAPARALITAFGNSDKTYTFSVKAEKAVMKADEGGVFGDPFEGISVDRGSLLIKFYGGSNWRWYRTYRFRFQNNDWYLIGATIGSYFTGTSTKENGDELDYNLLTGNYSERKTDAQGNTKTTKGKREKEALIRLTDFDVSSEKSNFGFQSE